MHSTTRYLTHTCLKALCLCVSLFACSTLHAQRLQSFQEIQFGGPILAFAAVTLPPENFELEFTFAASREFGFYDKDSNLVKGRNIHQYSVTPFVKVGLTDKIDLTLFTTFFYTHTCNADSYDLGDTFLLFGIQALRAQKGCWTPDIRVLIGSSFPTGKFDQLDPNLNGGDGVGAGSYEPTFLVSIAKVYPISEHHALRFNPNLYYITSSPADVADFNIFGGGMGTKGVVKPGDRFIVDFPVEFNLNNHIILAWDNFFVYQNSGRFLPECMDSPFSDLPSTYNMSMAPAIEYNPSNTFSVVGGAWFSIAGRNSEAFLAGLCVITWIF